jgi:DNA-binding phage protein
MARIAERWTVISLPSLRHWRTTSEKKVSMARTKAATSRWDVVDNLGSDKQIAAYLEAALEDGDPQVVTAAIGDIVRVRDMMQLARETGLIRERM